MLKKWIGFFLISSSCLVYSQEQEIEIIDFAHLNSMQQEQFNSVDWEGIETICRPFEHAVELIPYFDYLQQVFHIENVIMTGGWEKETGTYLSIQFDKLYTMDSNLSSYNTALVERCSNVELGYGSSPDILNQILPSLKEKPLLFYLNTLPHSIRHLKEELFAISKTHHDHCVIVINVCKVPNKRSKYDKFDNFQTCSYRMVKDSLAKIYSSYSCFYLMPKTPDSPSKLVVIPQKWMKAYEEGFKSTRR